MHVWGVCMLKGGMYGEGDMHGEGGMHGMYPPLCHSTRYGRSMRGQYTSYWNAFLLREFFRTYENIKGLHPISESCPFFPENRMKMEKVVFGTV